MKTIKVIAGGVGVKYTDANGNVRHTLKTPQSGPFECEDAQAVRLVNLGVAVYVGQQIEKEEAKNSEKTLTIDELEALSYADLKKIAAELGVKPKGNKKADYIDAIMGEEEMDDDEMPELDVADFE